MKKKIKLIDIINMISEDKLKDKTRIKFNNDIYTFDKFTNSFYDDEDNNLCDDYNILIFLNDDINIEAPNQEVLTKKEKEYLGSVLKPFRDKVKLIKKQVVIGEANEYLVIVLSDDIFSLPNFKRNTMYKRMKLNKEYNLKDLGL